MLRGVTPLKLPYKNQKEAGAAWGVMSWPHLLQEPKQLDPSREQSEKTEAALGQARRVWEEGGQIPAGCCLPAPSTGPSLPTAPPQELWRSSFLHHSNRCSCFHWPGASLMLLAVLLLLGCHGSQPAGR